MGVLFKLILLIHVYILSLQITFIYPYKTTGFLSSKLHCKTALSFSSPILSSVLPDSLVFYNSSLSSADNSLKLELKTIKGRIDKLEKLVSSGSFISSGTKQGAKGSVGNFVDAITAPTIPINARTVEICSILSFFGIGALIGASLLDRLWLLGGVISAWWASSAVQKNNQSGSIARKVGAQTALWIQEIQEKYNQAIIFYRTGKLAYLTSKKWEQYETQFLLKERFAAVKKLATERAATFNVTMGDANFYRPLTDIWQVVVKSPSSAKKSLEDNFKITKTVNNVIGLTSSTLIKLFKSSDDFINSKSSSVKMKRDSSVRFRPSPYTGLTATRRSIAMGRRSTSNKDDSFQVPLIISKLGIGINNAVNILFDQDQRKDRRRDKSSSFMNWLNPQPPPPPPAKYSIGEKIVALSFLLFLLEVIKKLAKFVWNSPLL